MSITQPVRFQLKRTRGWRKPDGSVVVDRRTIWGNPFVIRGPYKVLAGHPYFVFFSLGNEWVKVSSSDTLQGIHRKAVDLFAQWFNTNIAEPGSELYEFRQRYGWKGFELAAVCRKLLHGKSLGCTCAPDMPCHGDVILKLANPELNLP